MKTGAGPLALLGKKGGLRIVPLKKGEFIEGSESASTEGAKTTAGVDNVR